MPVTRLFRIAAVGALTAALLAGGAVLYTRHSPPEATSLSGGGAPAAAPVATDLPGAIRRLQQTLTATPTDWQSWAALGSAYVQQGRITADPTYYPKALGALQRSLRLDTAENFAAMTGMGALAAARHDFSGAVRWAEKAQHINAYNAQIYGVKGDALIELGRYPDGFRAIQRMADLRPDTSSLARASYVWELRGNLPRARYLLERALDDATSPADVAFCRYYLGELAWNAGDPRAASVQYGQGLRADPSYRPLLEGRAKTEAALGDTTAALRDYRMVTAVLPQPQYLIELGDLYASLGAKRDATATYTVVGAEEQLLRANGVNTDLELSLYDTDHGRPAEGLAKASAEWRRRHSILVADALAWALHANGRNREALGYSKRARALGMRNALFFFHAGMIEYSLGQRSAARTDLTRALATNPFFSTQHAPVARRTLKALRS